MNNDTPNGVDMDAEISRPANWRGPLTKYRPDMPSRVIELMRCGRSKASVCAEFGVHPETLDIWERKHPRLKEALRVGASLAQAWWEEKAQNDLNAERFHSATWGLTMANRFNWRQKTDTTMNATVAAAATMTADEIKVTIAEIRELRLALGQVGAGNDGSNGEAKTGVLLPAPEAK